MAEALLRADQLGGRGDYRTSPDASSPPLTGRPCALVDDEAGAVRVADAVYYLRAYAQAIGQSRGEEQRR